MDKIYEYNGKYYSNTDHSLEVAEDKWGGDLQDLYFDHQNENVGVLCEVTYYYSADNPEKAYEEIDDLIADVFEDYEVNFEQIKEQDNE